MSEIREAADAIRKFGEAAERAIDRGIWEAVPAGRTLVSRSWAVDRSGRTTLTLTLDDGRTMVGYGEAKLEALIDLERYGRLRPLPGTEVPRP